MPLDQRKSTGRGYAMRASYTAESVVVRVSFSQSFSAIKAIHPVRVSVMIDARNAILAFSLRREKCMVHDIADELGCSHVAMGQLLQTVPEIAVPDFMTPFYINTMVNMHKQQIQARTNAAND